jgi:four helix bundle protein
MDEPYDLRERSFLFARDIVGFCRVVARRDPILRRLALQLTDSGTSVGANLAEGVDGHSKPDFISKQTTALKESGETRYWLRLIAACEPSLAAQAAPLIQEAKESSQC